MAVANAPRGLHITFLGIVWTLLIGFLAGLLSRLLVPSRRYFPIWLSGLAGVAGAAVGLFVTAALGFATTSGIEWIELMITVGLAVLFATIAVGVFGRRVTRR